MIDVLGAETLQEIQDAFTTVTGYELLILDDNDKPLTRESDCERLSQRVSAIERTLDEINGEQQRIPIVVAGQSLGAMAMTGQKIPPYCDDPRAAWRSLGDRFGIDPKQLEDFAAAAVDTAEDRRTEATQFLYLITDAIAQICQQEIELRQRVEETTTLYQLSRLLAGQRELSSVLQTLAQSIAAVFGAKASSIRLLSEDEQELIPQAVYNLSQRYLDKGPIRLERNPLDREALEGKVVYVRDMGNDPRVLYPADARREGLSSILCAGMVYRGRPVGVMRVYTGEPRNFTDRDQELLLALSQLAAGAIRNAQLHAEQEAAQRVQRQVQLAADVQRRLLPVRAPIMAPFDFAGAYDPCFELGGDFYDFIPLEKSVGVVVGDVVGKGLAASLLMASVRAGIRAHAEDVYDLDEIMMKVNAALAHDTRDNEFATVFYGALDPATMRLTYCSAGHEPALLLRGDSFQQLEVGGMVLGIDDRQPYDKGLVDLQAGDILVVHTDGVTDATNFNGEKFARDRLRKAVRDMSHESAQRIAQHVLWEVRRFAGLNKRPDDMTLAVVKVNEAGAGASR